VSKEGSYISPAAFFEKGDAVLNHYNSDELYSSDNKMSQEN